MDPSPHGEFGDEDVATLGEQDGRLSRDHLDLGVGLHDLLNPGQRQRLLLVIVGAILERLDGMMPIGGENITIIAVETLVDLDRSGAL